ncbi:MAG: right-handed parallel beta-helix repeat-containing protein, partial [Planctomycetota bacterium]
PSCTLTGFNIDNYIVGFDRLIDPNGENHTHATISYCILENFLIPCDVAAVLACDGIISNCLIANIYPGCLVPWRVAQIKGCHGLIKNCTIADIPDGIEVMEGGTCTIENSILYHRASVFVSSGATLNISYCDLQGGLNGIEGGGTVNWGPGNIDTDPLFVRLGEDRDTQGDYHLLPASPCIDAGDPGYVPGPNETDLDGYPRIVSGIVDMGAHEFQGMRTLHVDMDAPQFGDGTSWATAFRHLQDALFCATPGTEIKVAEGIYKPYLNTYSLRPSSREDTFQLKIGVVIKGGYAGLGQPDPNARDISLYETILSGDMNGDDEPNFVNNSDNSLHVVTGSGTDATAVLDGFTITAGNGENGAGMYNESGSPRVIDCTFVENSAIHGGGAMRNRYSDPALTNCTFRENFSGTSGGGAMVNYYSHPTLLGCTFSENATAGDGGGMDNDFDSSPTLIDCTFSGNTADGRGGGIGNSNDASAVLVNCRFLGNSAAWSGGGMASSRGGGTLLGCTFSGNSSDKHGGALSGTATITNCTFSANSAEIGGGIYGGESSLTNSILWGNRDFFGAGEEAQICGGTLIVDYSCIQGWSGALGGTGNIADDPWFVEAVGADHVAGTEDDNLRLLSGSPCLDAGDNSALPPSLITDLDGNPRVVNGVVDMGAYEGPKQGFRLNTQAVTVAEGQAATFTVALAMDPLGTVEVTVAHRSGDSDITVVSGASLVFNSSNYTQPQTVTLAAAEDADYFNGSAVIGVSASGFVTAALGALEWDNDTPAVLYVDDSATGADDGTSWSDAFTDLQEALAVAAGLSKVKEIRVGQGIYTPAGPGGDRDATFQLLSNLVLRGGYAGLNQPDPDARDVETYETILSGDLDGNDGPDFTNNGENSRHVVTGRLIDETAVLDGFTITAGNGYEDADNYGYKGGGMYVESSNPTLVDCTFRGNLAVIGGGMYIKSGSSTLTGCTFRGNMAFHDDAEFNPGGGGLYSSDSSLTISRCTFINNSVTASYHGGGDGGGAFFGSSDANLTDCVFIGNSVRHYGGAMTNWGGDITLVNCVFSGNRAGRESGGLDLYKSNSTLIQCTLAGNSAESTAGGIYLVQPAEATLSNCILWGNTVSDVADQSTQIYLDEGATAAVNYSCVQGWTGNLGGTGNIGADPCFVDPNGGDNTVGTEDDNLRLSLGSPCIDTGENTAVPPSVLTDLDGKPRIICDTVDMGAYEFWGPIYVDDDGPNDPGPDDPQVSDPHEDGTEAHPFDTIQEGINIAQEGYTVLVRQGSYFEPGTGKSIDFLGKNITLTSMNPTDWDIVDNTIILGYV